jgi:23S rRNA (guanine2445-N2)-methyltransferase / 23S rRNA (guanine2069-N7)-methyltransferase
LLRDYFGFSGWQGHVPKLWGRLREEALARREEGIAKLPEIIGYDMNPRAVQQAKTHAERAGLQQVVYFEQRALSKTPKLSNPAGLVVVNPPYGQRLGEVTELGGLYAELGQVLKRNFQGWKAAVFTGNPQLGHALGLRALLDNKLYNGPIECRLLRFEVEEGYFTPDRIKSPPIEDATAEAKVADSDSSGTEMLANRLRKNRRILGRWARRANIACYRLYDADLPEYALAVDLYQGEQLWVHVQEYQAPRSIDQDKARHRREEALVTIADVLEISPEQVFLKVRHRQKGHSQYEKIEQGGAFCEVREGPCRLLVNFANYLDTGLFLDHRLTRELVAKLAQGRSFLNLFAYTGVATVRAAMEGAASTTSVDMSQTYLDWAQRNLELNDLHGHELVRADCLEWLARKQGARYGVIFLDPPTFSNSKKMDQDFDVQRDHVELIKRAVALLEEDGVLIFSNNYRRFLMDKDRLTGLNLEDITRQTIPNDFERRPKIHNCWKITRMSS